MIQIKLFKKEWAKIKTKLDEINDIPKSHLRGKEFIGIDIEDDGLDYNTETNYSGGGTDIFYFHVNWNELNKPIEYFKKKYNKEIEIYSTAKALAKKEDENKIEIKERNLLKKLKEKYENI